MGLRATCCFGAVGMAVDGSSSRRCDHWGVIAVASPDDGVGLAIRGIAFVGLLALAVHWLNGPAGIRRSLSTDLFP